VRHKLAFLICILAIVAMAYVVSADHTSALRQLIIQNAKTATSQAKAKVQAELVAHRQTEANDAKLATNQKGCQNGLAAYDLLTMAQIQKNHVVKPVCSL